MKTSYENTFRITIRIPFPFTPKHITLNTH